VSALKLRFWDDNFGLTSFLWAFHCGELMYREKFMGSVYGI